MLCSVVPLVAHFYSSPKDGVRLADEVGAKMYVECSSFTQDGLKNVFEQAVRVALSGVGGSSGSSGAGGAKGGKGPCVML